MLESYYEQLNAVSANFNERQIKKLQVGSLLNLTKKLERHESDEIEKSMYELKGYLDVFSRGDMSALKIYLKQVQTLKEKVQKEFGYKERGSVTSQYTALGMVFGTSLSIVFSTSNPSMLSIGIGVGLAIGAGIGNQKEKELDKKGLIY